MASAFTIKIDSHVKDVLKDLDGKIELALDAMGEVVEGYAKEDCPVDTGLLRNSITYAVAGKAPKVGAYHADKTSTGESATTGTTGSVRFGSYSGSVGSASDHSVYIGSNVEYAAKVELSDSQSHYVGKAHFLRDGATKHIDEIKNKAEVILNN